MFYAHFVLAKKGPLARIWLAAHWDKKLTKAHVYETNIEQSVEGIMQPKVKMALRTSGHLLLGVVRIYSRKAKYLLNDCNEAFVKIKMAFRPGMVDLPEDKREAAMNAITLPDVFHDFDTDIPDLDDMDIQAQFNMNQTRAEEITMREDYGNITLSTGDDGFGDTMQMAPRTPEILRDAPIDEDHFGSDINLDNEVSAARLQREESASLQEDGATSLDRMTKASDRFQLDAPIQEDGFGGVGLVQDILAGGLFEGGNLFDDDEPTPGTSSNIDTAAAGGGLGDTDFDPPPPASSVGDDDDRDDFGGMGSPMGGGSDGNSRPPTPMESESVLPPPQLDQTPVAVEPSSRLDSLPGQSSQEEAAAHEQTTLLQNEEESFALAPVDASALKGDRRKRKRKLIVDDVKAISGEGMKAQLSDSADIVTTLDIAPPTKRLMHWKETGGVEELFNLPGRTLGAKPLKTNYLKCLKMRLSPDEQFDTLHGDSKGSEPLRLADIGVEKAAQRAERPSAVKEKPAKRKRMDTESAYAKRQQELARQAEEFAREEEAARLNSISIGRDESGTAEQDHQPDWSAIDTTGARVSGLGSPGPVAGVPSFGFATPSTGFPTPVHQPAGDNFSGAEANFLATPSHSEHYPAPPAADLTPAQQSTFTEQWVNQVQNDPGVMSPPAPPPCLDATDDHQDDDVGGEDNYYDDGSDTEFPADIENGDTAEGDNEMQEDETIEQYEDRVLNKRAAQMHHHLSKKFSTEKTIDLRSLLKNNSRKQVAQKFYSILVLQKVMAVNALQSSNEAFSPISVEEGPQFASALKNL